MEKMRNRPCLDMEKAIKLIKQHCDSKNINSDEFVKILESTYIWWFSRSVATAIFIFCKDCDENRYVLASERWDDAADFNHTRNCPCGYLDYNEDTKDCAVRECFEEIGISIPKSYLKFLGFEDETTANLQNITFFYYTLINDKIISDFKFSKKNNEGKEVWKIKWMKLDEIKNYERAFNHEKIIIEIYNNHIRK